MKLVTAVGRSRQPSQDRKIGAFTSTTRKRHEAEMKGGGHQHRWDVRRQWKCAECGATRKTAGSITFQACSCSEPPRSMVLIGLPPDGFPNSPEVVKQAVANASKRAVARVVEDAEHKPTSDFANYDLESSEPTDPGLAPPSTEPESTK